MNILHIFSDSLKIRFGGQNIIWKDNFKLWENETIKHFVLDYQNGEIVVAKEYFEFNYPDVQNDTPRLKRLLSIIQMLIYLIKLKGKYDLIHLHTLSWAGLLVGPWARLNKIPSIYESVLQGSDTPEAIKATFLGYIKYKCLKSFTAILTISKALEDDYLNAGFERKQLYTLMNPVNEKIFRPIKDNKEKIQLRQNLALPSDSKIILFVGSVKRRKGIQHLIKAFIECSFLIKNLFLLIIGPANKNDNPSIEETFVYDLHQQLEVYNLTTRVKFVGLIKEKELLADFYRVSDVFVFPSHREGLGNVVLEAMSSGLPVVASELPVLRDVIKNNVDGVFVPIGEHQAIVDSLLYILRNPAFQRKLGHEAVSSVSKCHRYKDWEKGLISLYKKAVKRGSL